MSMVLSGIAAIWKVWYEQRVRGGEAKEDAPTIETEPENQNAVEPIRSKDADVWYCGNCDAIVGEETLTMGGIQEVRHNYCPECGRKVKWG